MARVLIESEIWDSICRHYAQLEQSPESLTDEDRIVISYIRDKILRQIRHDGYRPRPSEDGYSSL